MTTTLDPRLFRGLSVYQDVVLDGRTVLTGSRDCEGRWNAIAPHLPAEGCFLDVGSNFGWFGLRLCESPGRVVASVEADERSATIQRTVLASHDLHRICLLTDRADPRMSHRFAAAGQRFDGALVLSVLHWMNDHREFLTTLGSIANRIFVEQPDPREEGAGLERVRREIGPIGPYLGGLFPDRSVVCLATWPSHRESLYPRELWMVGEPPGGAPPAAPGLDVGAMVDLSVSWPPRSWWRSESQIGLSINNPGGVRLTAEGLEASADQSPGLTWEELRRRSRRIPEKHLWTLRQTMYRRARRLVGAVWRRVRGHE